MTISTRCALLAKQACTTLSHVVQKITPPSANNFLKLFFALFAMLALGVGNAWGAEETESYTCAKGTIVDNSMTWNLTSCTIEHEKAESSNNLAVYAPWRIYAQQTITITPKSGITITKMVITSTSGDYATAGTKTWTNATATSSSTSITVIPTDGTSKFVYTNTNSGQTRWQSVVITYTSGGTEPPTPADTYDVTWMVNGEEWDTTEDVEENTQITTLPTEPTDECAGKVFQGWTDKEITDGQKPAVLFKDKSPEITGNTTFYAVFATVPAGGGTGGSITISSETENFPTAYGTDNAFTEYTLEGYKFKIQQVYISGTKLQWRASGNSHGTGTMYNTQKFPANIASIVVVFDESDTNKNHTVKVGATENPTSGTSITPSNSGSTYTFDCSDGSYDYFVLTNGTYAGYVSSITINYGSVATPSDYTTSCDGTPDVIVKTLEYIAVSGMTTEYVEGAEFAFDGTCEATYSVKKNDVPQDNETKTVTPTVSAPNMTQIGEQTVTVSYTDGEVTAETSYTINISEKPKYTITWNNAGTTNTTEVVQGEAFGTLPEPADCDNGKKFMGWTAVTSVNNDGSGITYIKPTDKPTANTTYYAVFAVVEGGDATPTTATVTIADYADAKSWTDKQQYLDITVDANITATATGGGNTGKYYTNGENWRLYQNESATLTISAAEGYEIQTVTVTYTVDNTGVLTLEGSNVVSGTENEINAASVTFSVGNTGSATNGQVRITAIEVVYALAAETSDYSLDCTIHTEPTWTISKDEIDFGAKYVGFEYTETFTINASNLTDDIALAIDGSNFSVSPTSIATDAEFPQTVTVTYAPTAVDTHNATLNITSGSTLSKAIALTGSATEATIYTLTALADINPTDKVIIVGTSGGNTYAMSNDKGASDAPDAVAVTVTDNKIATDKTNILWNIAKDGDNLTIYPADQTAKWLYCLADENDGVRVGTGNAKEFTIDKGYLYTTQTTYARHIGIYNNSDWRCYKPSGDAIANNIKDQSFAFYVLPDTDPSISVNTTSKDFGVLTIGETATQEIEITTLNITQALTAELTGEGFTKSEIVDNKITITFAPTEVKEYLATLTISAGTEASASVTLAGEGVAAAYSVTYDKNGAEGDAPTDDTKYVAGSNVTVAGQGDMTMAGYRFAGWKYGEDTYKAGAEFTMPAEDVTFVAQWVEKEDFSTGYWVLVTDANELKEDDYVVIAAADYNVAMKSYETGNNCKQVEVTKVNNLLTWNENVGVFQLTKSGDIYIFQDVNTEQYLYAAGGTSNNYLRAADDIEMGPSAVLKYVWTISITDGKATIKAQIEDNADKKAHNWLRYNNTESGKLFSCYDANSNQKDIALYKYVTELPTPTPDYTRTVTNGNYGTICLPYGSSNFTGAEFYEVAGKETGKVVLDQVTELVAGVPYIFKATANELKVVYEGEAAEASKKNGLHGTFTDNTPVAEEMYIVYDNQLRKCGTGCIINANRAYLNLEDVNNGVPAQMPGRKRVGMAVTGENGTTDLDNIMTPNGKATKVLHNGQIIIIRNGEKFNAQGQKL